MIKRHIMLNNRKRFVFSAALAAGLVLLAGGANALAYNVICVPNVGVNPSCTAAPSPHTISKAVSTAAPFDIIFVGPGTYHESVTISTPAISLFGAQAGNDAREDRHDASKESIVDATGQTGPAFIVNASYVVIDGFTVQGGTAGTPAAGIAFQAPSVTPSCGVGGTLCGPQVLNNIIQNNSAGVVLDTPVAVPAASLLQAADIERNLFRCNNAPGGTYVGVGIYSDVVEGLVITENEFTGNKAAAMVVVGTQGATITKNSSENDGAFVVFLATMSSQFSHNQGEKFGHAGVLPVTLGLAVGVIDPTLNVYPDAAVDIGPGNSALEISHNELENGKAPICNGIAFTTAFPGGNSHLLNVINNEIKRFPDYGIVAEDTPSGGTLYNSSIIGNEVYDNGIDGIFIAGSLAYNYGIDLFDNEAEGNVNKDCEDDTGPAGPGTRGTLNYWFNNSGNSSLPTGLCTPEKRHDHH